MTASFEVDFSTLPLALRYKLLTALVVPRPIALVTTVGKDGVVNAAPFSFLMYSARIRRSSSSACNRGRTARRRTRSSISVRPAYSSSTALTRRWPSE